MNFRHNDSCVFFKLMVDWLLILICHMTLLTYGHVTRWIGIPEAVGLFLWPSSRFISHEQMLNESAFSAVLQTLSYRPVKL